MKNTFKLSLAATLVASTMGANAAIYTGDNEKGSFYIDGDIELNTDYQSRESDANRDDSWGQSGRILLQFGGEQKTETGYTLSFNADTLVDIEGLVEVDDAWFAIGHDNGAEVMIGRFEAYDMFPVGQDIFLEYTGDTANDLIKDGSAYQYQMKEGRGRGETGQIMYSHTLDNWYFEFATRIGDTSGIFADDQYHGQAIIKNKDSFIVRPVVAYQMGNFRFSVGMETNLVSDSVTTEDDSVDISDQMGYGFSTNYNSNGFDVNFNVAYKDGVDETNTSIGVNTTWMGFGFGYIYGLNDYENKEIAGYYDGEVEVLTANVSYIFEAVIADNLDISLGAYYTTLDADIDDGTFNEDDDMGARVRLLYDF